MVKQIFVSPRLHKLIRFVRIVISIANHIRELNIPLIIVIFFCFQIYYSYRRYVYKLHIHTMVLYQIYKYNKAINAETYFRDWISLSLLSISLSLVHTHAIYKSHPNALLQLHIDATIQFSFTFSTI